MASSIFEPTISLAQAHFIMISCSSYLYSYFQNQLEILPTMPRRYFLPMLALLVYTVIVVRLRSVYESNQIFINPLASSVALPSSSSYFSPVTHNNTYQMSNASEEATPMSNVKHSGRKRIAFYHPYHTGLIHQLKTLDMGLCQYKNCYADFTGNTRGFVNAHAVLFQGNHMPPVIPKRLNSDQVFVFINVEAPQYLHYTNLANPKFRNYFNWTMTYRLDSDIPYPYGSIALNPNVSDTILVNFTSFEDKIMSDIPQLQMDKINTALQKVSVNGIPDKPYRTIFRRKTKGAAWLVSHCVTASKREKYVHAMKRQIHIDVFGKCSRKSCKKGSEDCLQSVIRNYFFYFSFENSLCNDYVTEKEFNWFNEDIITVVRGARTYKNILPVGTYIDASDFRSPAELGKFLFELSNDEDRYIAYLKRKDHFRAVDKDKLVQNAYCELCKRLNHLDKYRKSVKDIRTWWVKDKCTQPFDIYAH